MVCQIGLGIATILYLLQGLAGSTVKFKLEDIDVFRCLDDAVCTTLTELLLRIDGIAGNQSHDQIECIVEIQFAILLILLRPHGVRCLGQERREQPPHRVKVTLSQRTDKLLHPWQHAPRLSLLEEIVCQHLHEAPAHLIVGEVQQIAVIQISQDGLLDSEVSTLEDHGQRLFHVSPVVGKLIGPIFLAEQQHQVVVVLGQQAHQILR